MIAHLSLCATEWVTYYWRDTFSQDVSTIKVSCEAHNSDHILQIKVMVISPSISNIQLSVNNTSVNNPSLPYQFFSLQSFKMRRHLIQDGNHWNLCIWLHHRESITDNKVKDCTKNHIISYLRIQIINTMKSVLNFDLGPKMTSTFFQKVNHLNKTPSDYLNDW